MSRRKAELIQEIAASRASLLSLYQTDPFAYVFNAVHTKDEHDKIHPIKRFPKKKYLELALDCIHNGEPVEFIIKSRQLMLTWLAISYVSWHCRFNPHKLAFVQSKKEEDAANLIFNKHESIARLSFIESHLPEWLRQDVDWSYGIAIYPNGSKAWAIPQGPQHYESYVPSLVINDEASLQDKWNAGHSALKPCIEGGGRCITISTVRMPSEYSDEMATFDPEASERVMRGFWKFKSKSGASAHAIHYTADQEKNPEKGQGKAWYAEATRGYIGGADSHLWRQHMEIDFEATSAQRLIPFWAEHSHNFVIDPIPIDQQINWKYYSGFDYGKRNLSVWGVYAVDQHGNRYICDEVAGAGESMGGVPGIADKIRRNPYFSLGAGRNIKADPSIWNKNQADGSSYTSVAQLFQEEGIMLHKAPCKGQEADSTAIERLLYHYWSNPEQPSLFIFRGCRTHIRQWRKLRYREISSSVQQNKAIVEQLVDRDNDSWDAWKYAEASRAAPKRINFGPPVGSFEYVRRKAIRMNRERPQPVRWGRVKPMPIGAWIG